MKNILKRDDNKMFTFEQLLPFIHEESTTKYLLKRLKWIYKLKENLKNNIIVINKQFSESHDTYQLNACLKNNSPLSNNNSDYVGSLVKRFRLLEHNEIKETNEFLMTINVKDKSVQLKHNNYTLDYYKGKIYSEWNDNKRELCIINIFLYLEIVKVLFPLGFEKQTSDDKLITFYLIHNIVNLKYFYQYWEIFGIKELTEKERDKYLDDFLNA